MIARGWFGVGYCRWRPSLWTAVFFCCAFLASTATASAAGTPYRYEEAQSKALNKAAPGEAFLAPFGLSFDSAGNLFVADTSGHEGAGVIDKFDANDAFQAQLGGSTLTGNFTNGVAVNDETGHIYVGDSNFSEVFVLDQAGEGLSQWTGANTPAKSFGEGCCFVYTAVDNSPSVSKGEIYVSTTQEGGKVYVFEAQGEDKEEGEVVRELEAPGGLLLGGGGSNIAVNQASGEVYVADAGRGVVDRFSATGEYEASAQIKGISPSEPFAEPVSVAVDAATGNVFVGDQEKLTAGVIDEFTHSGEFLTQIKETGEGEVLQQPVALAVQQAGPHAGELYVTDAGRKALDVLVKRNPEAPSIEGLGVQGLSGDSVSFLTEIDPHGSPTEYRFEYGRCSSPTTCPESPYEHRLPEPDALLGFEDFKGHTSASFHVKDLSASSTYHVRAIAHNALGEVIGEERTFTTQGPGGTLSLPDERSWELVSPPDKHAGVLSPQPGEGVIEAAADGSAIAYLANAPTEASPEGFASSVQVLSRRTGSAWSSRDIASPHVGATGSAAGVAPEYRLFAEDLSAAVLQPGGLFNPALSVEASEQTPYLRTLGACTSDCYRPLVTAKAGFANVPAGTGFGEELLCEEDNGAVVLPVCGPRAQGASLDASHVVLRSAAPLGEGLPRNELYEWATGQLQLVSVLAANEAGEELPAPTGPELNEQPLLGTAFGVSGPSARRAISSDGSRVFWESEATLYMRDMAKGETLQVDAAEAGCPEGECEGGAGRFEIASADGSRVFFTDKRRLTKDAGAEVGVPDLYECRIFTNGEGKLACQITDLTPIEGGEGAFVQGAVFGASEDGSTVYFVANGVLAGSGATPGNCKGNAEEQPSSARCNLYELREGKAKLVAVLSGADAVDWTRAIESQPTRVSPSGQWLSFMSSLPLSGYDNHDAVSGRLDAEIFVYDAATEELSCASCNPSGARPAGVEYGQLESRASLALRATRGEWETKEWVAALPPHTDAIGPAQPNYQPRYLSDSGRMFFNSLDALVPEDVNATGDVYEHEPAGVGSCTAPGGCVSLISSGESPEASAFLDASESGDDVFFLTAQRLTRSDVDSREDIYDARVCSAASPCLEDPAQTPPACITESSCKAAPSPQPPAFGAPASQTFSGPGNPAPPPVVKAKAPTRAERLAKALKACRKRHPHARKRRVACERQARAKYGSKPKKKGHR